MTKKLAMRLAVPIIIASVFVVALGAFFSKDLLNASANNNNNNSSSINCPEELPECNKEVLENYNKPMIFEDEMNISDQDQITGSNLGRGPTTTTNLPSNTASHLMVPYFNQYVQADGSIYGTRYHCGAASVTMIAGYFNKLPYKGDDESQYKKYMLSNNGQGITETCAGQGGAFGITGYRPDCRASYPQGISNYLKKMNMNFKIISGTGAGLGRLQFEQVKNAIDRGNPLIVSSSAHYYVIKGYTTDGRIIVNDSWKDASKRGSSTFIHGDGRNAVYDLNNLYPYNKTNYRNTWFVWEVSNPDQKFYEAGKVNIVNPSYKKDEQIISKKPSSENSNGVNTRESADGKIIKSIPWGTTGTVKAGPVFKDGTGWYQIRWSDGTTGWSAAGMLAKPVKDGPAEGDLHLAQDLKKCIDLAGGKIEQNARMQLWFCNNGGAQKWTMPFNTSSGKGKGQIKLTVNKDWCMDFNARAANASEGRQIILSKCSNNQSSSTEWVYTDKKQIQPAAKTDLCLTTETNTLKDGQNLVLKKCDGSKWQSWSL
jgi:Ricin-type beta-trefoil lectin domain/Peptidase_C39 like family